MLTILPFHLLIQGIDDALAMFYLLMNPKVKLTAVTLTHGNTNIDHVKRNAETVLHVMRKQRESLNQEVPVEELPVLAIGMEWKHVEASVVCVCVCVCVVVGLLCACEHLIMTAYDRISFRQCHPIESQQSFCYLFPWRGWYG